MLTYAQCLTRAAEAEVLSARYRNSELGAAWAASVSGWRRCAHMADFQEKWSVENAL